VARSSRFGAGAAGAAWVTLLMAVQPTVGLTAGRVPDLLVWRDGRVRPLSVTPGSLFLEL
jgi:hypothetical protein